MKKMICAAAALCLALLMFLSFAACSKKSADSGQVALKDPNATASIKSSPTPNNDKTNEAITANKGESYNVKASECFPDNGYFIFTAGADATYKVKINNDEDSPDWAVYVLDDKYADGLDSFAGSHTPVLTGDGSITVTKGQYIYVYCSVNSSNSDEPAAGAWISFTGSGLPKN